MKYLIYIILCTSLIIGCTKKPTSCFTSEKTIVDKGKSIIFKDCSENAYYWEWYVDNAIYTGKDVEIFFEYPGQSTVTLLTYDNKKKKSASTSQTITVNQTYGNVTFWTNNPQYTQISVDVTTKGNKIITQVLASEPDCDQSGCANFYLETGTYQYTASGYTLSGASFSTTGSIVVEKDQCIKKLIT